MRKREVNQQGKSLAAGGQHGKGKVVSKPEVRNPKLQEESNSAFGIPIAIGTQSEVNKQQTAPDSYRDSKLQTETMEVHHHPEIEKKTFKQYLLEGLMIFLAVTMGFFAESLREHIADKKKETQIIIALIKDIKKDTASLNNAINVYMPKHNQWVDSADTYINTLSLKGNERKVTKAIINATSWWIYTPPEVALDILKNSGNFNLIENEKVKAQVLTYNGNVNEYIKYSEFVTAVQHAVDTGTTSLLSRKLFRQLMAKLYLNMAKNEQSDGFITNDDLPESVVFNTYNKAVFVNYLKKLNQVDNLLNDLLGLYKRILAEETKLLAVLKEQYNLKDE
jgi:hypothetical protein